MGGLKIILRKHCKHLVYILNSLSYITMFCATFQKKKEKLQHILLITSLLKNLTFFYLLHNLLILYVILFQGLNGMVV